MSVFGRLHYLGKKKCEEGWSRVWFAQDDMLCVIQVSDAHVDSVVSAYLRKQFIQGTWFSNPAIDLGWEVPYAPWVHGDAEGDDA